jgi:putative heme-binding domain-containing protein
MTGSIPGIAASTKETFALGSAPKAVEAPENSLAAEATSGGDAARCALIYAAARSTCVACHQVEGQGGILGPDLSSIGRAMTPEAIVESVLWPKRQVKEGFLLTQITTKDGRIVQGHVAEESAAFVTLKDVAGNPGAPIAKAEIVARRDSGTLMPEGWTAWMSEQQRLDLLRYLFGLGLDE